MFSRVAVGAMICSLPILLAGCAEPSVETGDGLTPAQALAVDALPLINAPIEDIVLPSGESVLDYLDENGEAKSILLEDKQSIRPQERRKRIISAMLARAAKLCKRADWQYVDEGQNKPAQNGLAYLWGGKNHLVRQGSSTDECPEELHGLDCSGLVYQCAMAASLPIMVGPARSQEVPENWTKLFPEDWNLRMELASDATPQTGDIIGWGTHIGIVGKNAAGALVVYQSNGNRTAADCVKNYSQTRGPRALTFAGAVDEFGSNYKLLRIVAEISGEWDMFLRCSGQTTDAISIRFTISNRNGGAFSASGNGVDYDGSPFTALMEGTYDPILNKLEATIDYSLSSGQARVDGFEIVLNFDSTGYFDLTKIVDNGGCRAQARLVNLDPAKAMDFPVVETEINDGPRIDAPRL